MLRCGHLAQIFRSKKFLIEMLIELGLIDS